MQKHPKYSGRLYRLNKVNKINKKNTKKLTLEEKNNEKTKQKNKHAPPKKQQQQQQNNNNNNNNKANKHTHTHTKTKNNNNNKTHTHTHTHTHTQQKTKTKQKQQNNTKQRQQHFLTLSVQSSTKIASGWSTIYRTASKILIRCLCHPSFYWVLEQERVWEPGEDVGGCRKDGRKEGQGVGGGGGRGRGKAERTTKAEWVRKADNSWQSMKHSRLYSDQLRLKRDFGSSGF